MWITGIDIITFPFDKELRVIIIRKARIPDRKSDKDAVGGFNKINK